MESSVEGNPRQGGEIGIIINEGKEYGALGAFVSAEYATAYPGKDGILYNWGTEKLGTWRIVASWPVRSWMGSRMLQIEAVIDGRTYTGRGFGEGMVWNGKIKKGGSK